MDAQTHAFFGKIIAAMRQIVGALPSGAPWASNALRQLENEHAAMMAPPAPAPFSRKTPPQPDHTDDPPAAA